MVIPYVLKPTLHPHISSATTETRTKTTLAEIRTHTQNTHTTPPHIRWLTVTRKGVSSERDSHRVEMATLMREKGKRTRERRKGLPILENVEERRPPTSALTHASDGSETTMIVLCLLGGSTDRKNSNPHRNDVAVVVGLGGSSSFPYVTGNSKEVVLAGKADGDASFGWKKKKRSWRPMKAFDG
ncbi:unnamed protein product [Lactuca saligna]|uniref:Uncharacterized protein n=1 Tax=Lactuca saligna TaxID=75948 RepID=A0AA35YU58_LACSI|nr:unnamed protein product [Lactuca saligna]